MKCDIIREMFADDWAGALDSDDRTEFDLHLAGCEACRKEREQLNQLWAGLAAIPFEEPRSDSRQRFYSMLEGHRQGIGRSRPPQQRSVITPGISESTFPAIRDISPTRSIARSAAAAWMKTAAAVD